MFVYCLLLQTWIYIYFAICTEISNTATNGSHYLAELATIYQQRKLTKLDSPFVHYSIVFFQHVLKI